MIVDLLSTGDRQSAQLLVEEAGLRFEAELDELVGIYEAGVLVATAARQGNVLKLFALDPRAQGGTTLAELAGELLRRAFSAGHASVFVFTKPEYVPSFEQLNFQLLATTESAALLEHGGGFGRYLERHRALARPGDNGAVVVNANPFTLGHRYLIENAAARCERLYVFVVEEERSVFPYPVRRSLVEQGCADLAKVQVLGTGRYAVSAQTFPSYFLKSAADASILQMEIDLTLFAERIAPFFAVRRRFVGHEPYCATTRRYNETMRQLLGRYGIALELVERSRLEVAGAAAMAITDNAQQEAPRELPFVSATHVRRLLREQGPQASALPWLVPATTLACLQSAELQPIIERLRNEEGRHS